MSGTPSAPINDNAPLTLIGGAGIVCEGDSCLIPGASTDSEAPSPAS